MTEYMITIDMRIDGLSESLHQAVYDAMFDVEGDGAVSCHLARGMLSITWTVEAESRSEAVNSSTQRVLNMLDQVHASSSAKLLGITTAIEEYADIEEPS